MTVFVGSFFFLQADILTCLEFGRSVYECCHDKRKYSMLFFHAGHSFLLCDVMLLFI